MLINQPLSLSHYRNQKAAEAKLRYDLTICVALFDLAAFALIVLKLF